MTRHDLLRTGLQRAGVQSDDERVERLEAYVRELERWNPKLGLVSASGDELVVRHILDCAVAIPAIAERLRETTVRAPGDCTVADVGSGAGLPGIPLAILMPELRVTLIERSGRRTGFLRNAVIAAGTTNVSIVGRDVSAVTEQFDGLTFRAFHPLTARLWHELAGRLVPGGFVAAYKGRRDNVDSELDRLRRELGPQMPSAEIAALDVPFLDEPRCLLMLTPR